MAKKNRLIRNRKRIILTLRTESNVTAQVVVNPRAPGGSQTEPPHFRVLLPKQIHFERVFHLGQLAPEMG